MTPWIPGLLALAAYGAAAALLLRRLLKGARDGSGLRLSALLLSTVGLAAHTALLSVTVIQPEGLNLSLGNAAAVVGWQIVLVLLLVTLRQPVENLGIPILPLAGLSAVAGSSTATTRVAGGSASWPLDAHILLSLLAFSLLALGVVQSVVLALQERALRRHRPLGPARAMPPLETMERLLFQMLVSGFILLTLALLSGLLFVQDLFAQHLVHKTVLSIAAWLVFGVLLWGRWRYGWRGRFAARWTVAGGACLALAYFGSKFVLEALLGISWG